MYKEEVRISILETGDSVSLSIDETGDNVNLTIAEKEGPRGPEGPAGGTIAEGQNNDTATIVAGMAVAIHSSGTGFIRADNRSLATRAVGIADSDADPGFSLSVQISGTLSLVSWAASTSPSTANFPAFSSWFLGEDGFITQLPSGDPGTYSQFIGEAFGPSDIKIEIEQPIRRT